MKRVAVIMGSDSDLSVVKKAIDTLAQYGVDTEVHVFSAHRCPAETAEFARRARENGIGVIIEARPPIWPAPLRPTPPCL